jgi:coenzyme Q-binding protein COQ10
MPSHSETRVLPYTSEQLFDLVMDIESYPEFLPWCMGARINSRSRNNLEADVIIGYKMLRERFSSRVHYTPHKSIEVEYMQGPMRQLHNKWTFRDLKNGQCRVEFYVEFSMKTRFLEKLVDQFFHLVLARMINAFEGRARELYG